MLSAVDKLPLDPKYTDLTRWRLKSADGRQVWHYLSEEASKQTPQTLADKYWLGLPLVLPHLLHIPLSETHNVKLSRPLGRPNSPNPENTIRCSP